MVESYRNYIKVLGVLGAYYFDTEIAVLAHVIIKFEISIERKGLKIGPRSFVRLFLFILTFHSIFYFVIAA